MRVQLSILVFALQVNADSMSSRLTNCGVGQGCWLMPPGCEQTTGPDCMGIVSWIVSPSGIQFSLITYVNDLLDSYILNKSIYGAVGFSLDSMMGDDTVFVCAVNSTGQGTVFINWNDMYSSERMNEATELMIANPKLSLVNDRMNCEFTWVFSGLDLLSPGNERQHIFNLSQPTLEVFTMFARGSADPYTYQIHPHSVADGLLFPFISSETISFCSTGCGRSDGHEWITKMHQSDFSQNAKQKLTIAHATLMILSFFALIPTAALTVRFGKPHLYRIWGIYVWYHVHIICSVLAFCCILVAFICIYYQANFRLLRCSVKCESVAFLRQLHALIGTGLFATICLLMLISLRVPKVTSNRRMCWNFFHIFVGYSFWLGGCSVCFIGVGLPKTSLSVYGRWAQQMLAMGGFITITVFIVCEWVVHRERFLSVNPDRVEHLYNTEFPSPNDEIEFEEPPSYIPFVLIAFNAICGCVITSCICIMLTNASRINGFKI